MTRVTAYWGKDETTPKSCPAGRSPCFAVGESLRNGQWSCPYYKRSSMPEDTKSGVGPVIVLCSAPVATKGKTK